jgi:hypothetical protein
MTRSTRIIILLAYMGLTAIVVWLVLFTFHSAYAKAYEGPTEEYVQQMKPPPNAILEWHIRLFLATKDRHPIIFMDYSQARYLSAQECLSALAKPDKTLAATRKTLEPLIKHQFGEAVQHWTCAPFLTTLPGQGV